MLETHLKSRFTVLLKKLNLKNMKDGNKLSAVYSILYIENSIKLKIFLSQPHNVGNE